ncbi:conjugative transposon protein TraN [Dysgonomonas sp. 25]|uniref:conjugative transposon protein TraN n=1 Tax=Dysgonomonas sp. 25 TaxID=2302933 RepID=UPI0013D562F4|nr:conjugative transposon protein TraN [Dysgonomonas sp. 25]NDV69938.1 conjugative transposon protein TraN [Dysgonomonas sp. 25]
MKKYILILILLQCSISGFGQNTDENAVKGNRPLSEFDKDNSQDYLDMSSRIIFDRIIPPHKLEVTYDKTTHLIFPAPITYVDLGSSNIIAGKADGINNVLRVKAAVRNFTSDTNFSIITNDGSFYSFNVNYAEIPQKLNIEIKDFTYHEEDFSRPNNYLDIYLKELGKESPKLVRLVMESIYNKDERKIKHIGSNKFAIQFLLKGIYTFDGLLYLHTQIKNSSNVPFDVDFIRMKIIDKKVMKRTAIQETLVVPLRAFNNVATIGGKKTQRIVFALDKITIPDDKVLIIDLLEKNGGRHQSFMVENEDIVCAAKVTSLNLK